MPRMAQVFANVVLEGEHHEKEYEVCPRDSGSRCGSYDANKDLVCSVCSRLRTLKSTKCRVV
jgi:hypothetical protein